MAAERRPGRGDRPVGSGRDAAGGSAWADKAQTPGLVVLDLYADTDGNQDNTFSIALAGKFKDADCRRLRQVDEMGRGGPVARGRSRGLGKPRNDQRPSLTARAAPWPRYCLAIFQRFAQLCLLCSRSIPYRGISSQAPFWEPGHVCGWRAERRNGGWTRVVAWMPSDGNSPIDRSEGRWNARLLRTSVPVCPRAQGGRDKHRLGALEPRSAAR